MRAILTSRNFWLGVGVGLVVAPVALNKFAPGLKAKLPGQ